MQPPDFKLEFFYIRTFDGLDLQTNANEGEFLFHVWCETWMKREDLSLPAGWQVIDATPLFRVNGIHQLGPADVGNVKVRQDAAFDSRFVATELGSIREEVYLDENGNNIGGSSDADHYGKIIATKTPFQENYSVMLMDAYKPGYAPVSLVAPESTASIASTDVAAAGQDFQFLLRLKNASHQAREFSVFGSVDAIDFQGKSGPRLFTIQEANYVVNAESERLVPISVPWSNLGQQAVVHSRFEIRALLKCPSLDKTWLSTKQVFVDFAPLSVQSNPAKIVRFNDLVNFNVSFINPLPSPFQNASLHLDGDDGFRMSEQNFIAVVSLGTIQPNESLSVGRSARAMKRGPHVVSFVVSGTNAPATSEALSIRVVGCLGDLDGGDSVDDADFSLFVQSYNALLVPPADPASDLNRDGIVDDSDFMLFVQAYDRLLCD